MLIDQRILIFYVVFSVCRILFLAVRVNCCVGSMLLLLAKVLALSLSCANCGGQAVLAPMPASFAVVIEAAVGESLYRE